MSQGLAQLMSLAGYRTLASLAREVAKRWALFEPETGASAKPRNIEVKLGRLRKGDATWWKNHPEAARALSEALDVDGEVLGLVEKARKRYTFADFPRLRRFDAESESPCPAWGIVEQGRLFPLDPFRELPKSPRAWVRIPAGGGRRFLAHVWEKTTELAIIRGATLADCAAGARDHEQVVVVVESTAPSDFEVLEVLQQLPWIVVLSPFAPPLGIQSDHDDPWPWVNYVWRPRQNWRRHFIKWIAARFPPDVRLRPSVFLTWLDSVDPEASVASTPGAVLSLCALVSYRDVEAMERISSLRLGERLVEYKIQSAQHEDAPGKTWLWAHGVEALRALLQNRLEQVALPWVGGLPKATWSEMLPDELSPGRLSADRLTELLSAADDDNPARRRASLVQLGTVMNTPSGADAILWLQRVGLLVGDRGSLLHIHPAWLAEWWGRDRVHGVLTLGDPSVWGRWVLDPDRRSLVDDEIRKLSDADFGTLLSKVCHLSTETLGNLGAVETLFFAVADRLLSGWRGDSSHLHALWRRVRQQSHSLGSMAGPLTRTAPGVWPRSGEAWAGTCWAWSFLCPAPSGEAEIDSALFPGWMEGPLTFDTFAGHRARLFGVSPAPPAKGDWRPHPVLAHFARHIVSKVDALPPDVPELFLPAAILASTTGEKRWTLRLSHLRGLHSSWSKDQLVSEVRAKNVDSQRAVARRILDLLISKGYPTFVLMQESSRDVAELAVDVVTDDQIDRAIERVLQPHEEELTHTFLALPRLPRRVRLAVVRWLSTNAPTHLDALCEDPHFFDGELDLELLLMITDSGADNTRVIRRVWRSAPAAAFDRAQRNISSGEAARAWFEHAPAHFTRRLIGYLESLEESAWPPWVAQWLAARLRIHAGPDADRCFSLLRRVTGEEPSKA